MSAIVVLSIASLALPAAAGAASTTTTSLSRTQAPGNYSTYRWIQSTTGPATITVGELGSCVLAAGPYPQCTATGGAGSSIDPFTFQCSSPLPVSACAPTVAGTPPPMQFAVVAGNTNADVRVHSVGPLFVPPTTVTTTTSRSIGAVNASYLWTLVSPGPQTIIAGDRGSCALPAGPLPNCAPTGGSGTAADPFRFQCSGATSCTAIGGSGTPAAPTAYDCTSPVAVSGCSQPGMPFSVQFGGTNIDAHLHIVSAQAVAAGPALPVPLAPWIPAAAAAMIVAAATARRLFR